MNKNNLDSLIYMEMGLVTEGEEKIILRIPTFWDAVENQWIGAIQTPISHHIISATGKDSFELQNNFNIEISKAFQHPIYADEVFSMFKPIIEWEKN